MPVDLIDVIKKILNLSSMTFWLNILDDPRPIELQKNSDLILADSGLLKATRLSPARLGQIL